MRTALIFALAACSGAREAPVEPVFVRGGVILPAGAAAGQALLGGRVLVARDWRPGEDVTIGDTHGVAPRMAECVPLWSAALGDVSRLVAMGGEPPDTALSWSPDGARLAVGAYTGELAVLDGWSGAEIARERLAEGMVKRVAWSPDGRTLYAAEQSPDAFLWALDAETLAPRWKLRLADEVGSSSPPAGEDVYGVYALPAAFGLTVLPGGDLLVVASHGWTEGETRLNRSRLLRLSPEGRVLRAWPETAADAIFFEARLDPGGARLVMPVTRSASGPAPAGLPVGGAVVLSVADLQPVTTMIPDPLGPWFSAAFLWEGVDIDDQTVLLGLGDGRVQRWPLSGGEPRTIEAGTPILSGDVPISASVGFGLLHRGDALFITSNTNIPYGAASPELRPPAAHPGENTLWAVGADGATRWTWRGEQRLAGLSLSPDGRALVVGAGPRVADDRQDLYGALIFDLQGEGAGEERLSAFCGTAGPVFFRQALAADGRVAVAEVPTLGPDGAVRGTYQVTVLR